MWPVVSLAGITGSKRHWPAISGAGCARDAKKPAVGCAYTGNKRWIFRDFTGATGLEPATSGVTGRRSNQLNYAPRRNVES